MNDKRKLSSLQKKNILNRDGWSCNICGYIPFHQFEDIPTWATRSYNIFSGYMMDIKNKSPLIIIRWNNLPDTPDGNVNVDLCYLHGGELEFDHKTPISKGGSLELDNIQALCLNCHNKKSNFDYRYSNVQKYIFAKYLSRMNGVC